MKDASKKSIWYRKYYDMIRRCYSPKCPNYKYYGGRGITVCDRWRNSYTAFIKDMGVPNDKTLTIDRIDNSKGYSKDNCRWVDNKTNCRNRRNNYKLAVYKNDVYVNTFNSAVEASEKLKICHSSIVHYLNDIPRTRHSVGGYTLTKVVTPINGG